MVYSAVDTVRWRNSLSKLVKILKLALLTLEP